jgi:hypothetical protein
MALNSSSVTVLSNRGIRAINPPAILNLRISSSDSCKSSEAQYASYARSQGGFYGKYLRQGDLFIALRATVHLVRAGRRWAVGVLTREAEVARIGRAYLTGLIPGIVAGWRSGVAR